MNKVHYRRVRVIRNYQIILDDHIFDPGHVRFRPLLRPTINIGPEIGNLFAPFGRRHGRVPVRGFRVSGSPPMFRHQTNVSLIRLGRINFLDVLPSRIGTPRLAVTPTMMFRLLASRLRSSSLYLTARCVEVADDCGARICHLHIKKLKTNWAKDNQTLSYHITLSSDQKDHRLKYLEFMLARKTNQC